MTTTDWLDPRKIDYTGTIDSYNEIMKILFPYPKFHISFTDKKGNPTNKFTGNFMVMETGEFFRPGDTIQIKRKK